MPTDETKIAVLETKVSHQTEAITKVEIAVDRLEKCIGKLQVKVAIISSGISGAIAIIVRYVFTP